MKRPCHSIDVRPRGVGHPLICSMIPRLSSIRVAQAHQPFSDCCGQSIMSLRFCRFAAPTGVTYDTLVPSRGFCIPPRTGALYVIRWNSARMQAPIGALSLGTIRLCGISEGAHCETARWRVSKDHVHSIFTVCASVAPLSGYTKARCGQRTGRSVQRITNF